jgi:hypothetical protein
LGEKSRRGDWSGLFPTPAMEALVVGGEMEVAIGGDREAAIGARGGMGDG